MRKVTAHINSFPRESSHYAPKSDITYLPAELNAKRMWELFCLKYQKDYARQSGIAEKWAGEDEKWTGEEPKEEEKDGKEGKEGKEEKEGKRGDALHGGEVLVNGEEREGEEEKEGKTGEALRGGEVLVKPTIKYDFYRQQLRALGYEFARLAVDTCPDCDSKRLEISQTSSPRRRAELQMELAKHQRLGDQAYKQQALENEQSFSSFKKATTAAASSPAPSEPQASPSSQSPSSQSSSSQSVANSLDALQFMVTDMQGVLSTPRLSAGPSFYRKKLRTFNYDVYGGHDKKHNFFFWDEKEGGKGANQVLSAVYKYLCGEGRSGCRRLSWWSDNTSAQVKNYIVMAFLCELTDPAGFHLYQRADLKFAPKGGN